MEFVKSDQTLSEWIWASVILASGANAAVRLAQVYEFSRDRRRARCRSS
jgi:hypothetical protein